MLQERCTRCDKILNPKKLIMLELDYMTGEYSVPSKEPLEHSQGAFPFGPDCVKKVLNKTR